MLNKGLHSEKVGSWKPEAGRLLSDRQNRHSSRHPELVSGSEKLNSAASDPLCISPQGGKLLPIGEIERGQMFTTQDYCNPQNQIAYEACLTEERTGRGKKQFNRATGRVPGMMQYDPLYPPQGENSFPLGRLGGVSNTNLTCYAIYTKTLKVPSQIDLTGRNTKSAETRLAVSHRVVPQSAALFQRPDIKTMQNAQFAFPSRGSWRELIRIVLNGNQPKPNEISNINKNRIDKNQKLNSQSRLLFSSVSPLGGIPACLPVGKEGKGVTNSKNKFCGFNLEMMHEESPNLPCVPGIPVARISPPCKGGASLTVSVRERGFEPIPAEILGKTNRTVLT